MLLLTSITNPPFLQLAYISYGFLAVFTLNPMKEAECSSETVESIYKIQCNNPQTTAACGEVFLQITLLHILQKESNTWKIKNNMLTSSWKRWDEQQRAQKSWYLKKQLLIPRKKFWRPLKNCMCYSPLHIHVDHPYFKARYCMHNTPWQRRLRSHTSFAYSTVIGCLKPQEIGFTCCCWDGMGLLWLLLPPEVCGLLRCTMSPSRALPSLPCWEFWAHVDIWCGQCRCWKTSVMRN